LRHGIVRNKINFVIIEEVIIECVNVQVHSERRSFSWFGYFFQLGRECVLLFFLYYPSVLALHEPYTNDL